MPNIRCIFNSIREKNLFVNYKNYFENVKHKWYSLTVQIIDEKKIELKKHTTKLKEIQRIKQTKKYTQKNLL